MEQLTVVEFKLSDLKKAAIFLNRAAKEHEYPMPIELDEGVEYTVALINKVNVAYMIYDSKGMCIGVILFHKVTDGYAMNVAMDKPVSMTDLPVIAIERALRMLRTKELISALCWSADQHRASWFSAVGFVKKESANGVDRYLK